MVGTLTDDYQMQTRAWELCTILIRERVSNSLTQRAPKLHKTDVTVMVPPLAYNLFLLSRASSDAYEPYMFLKDHGEESLTPGVPGEIRTHWPLTRFTVAMSVLASVPMSKPATSKLSTGISYWISLGTPGLKLSSICWSFGIKHIWASEQQQVSLRRKTL